MSLLSQIRRGVAFLAIFIAAAAGLHMAVTGQGVLDSLYFVVVTISTVGYGEKSTASDAEKLVNMATILVGAVVVGYTINLIAKSMIEGQIRQALGIQRMTQEIKQLTGHTIICGFGRIGRTLAEEFHRRGKPFVVVDRNAEVVSEACDEHRLTVSGDATDEDTLIEAGIQRAETLIIALSSDADCVFLTLTARNLNPRLKIIARGEQTATEKKLLQAGADRVVLPAVIGAKRMAALVTRPHAAEMLDHFTNHEKIDADLEELTLPEGNDLIGKTVRETAARQKHQLLVIGIRRGDGAMLFNPDADTGFEARDTLIVMGRRGDITAFCTAHDLRS